MRMHLMKRRCNWLSSCLYVCYQMHHYVMKIVRMATSIRSFDWDEMIASGNSRNPNFKTFANSERKQTYMRFRGFSLVQDRYSRAFSSYEAQSKERSCKTDTKLRKQALRGVVSRVFISYEAWAREKFQTRMSMIGLVRDEVTKLRNFPNIRLNACLFRSNHCHCVAWSTVVSPRPSPSSTKW